MTGSPSLSAVAELDQIPTWKKGDEKARLDFIRKDCLARLEDVRMTNKKTKSLSAFISILTFIGQLSKMVFSKDQSLKQYKQNGCGIDQICFQAFCDKYLLNDVHYQSRINQPGLSYLLYKFVRCGLVHSGTLKNGKGTTQQLKVKIFLSHSKSSSQSLKDIDKKIVNASSTSGATFEYTINAFELCRDLKSAISNVFSSPPQSVRNSILDTFEEDTPILCYKGK